ncbi:MAG: response regulator transcription factor [Verrucomicrobia bacterium]|nr:response regulator transcription factor [Verrucomicrobiota bacterium]
METIRVFVAEDRTLLRAGIRGLLERIPGVSVIGESEVSRKLLNTLKAKRPNVLLVEIGTAGLAALEIITSVTRQFPEVRVVALSALANEERVLPILKAGASGYLLKRSTVEELCTAIQTVARGKLHVSRSVSSRLKKATAEVLLSRERPFERLTPRQFEILKAIAEGRNTKEIALLMNLSPKTVAFHRVQLMQRLKIHNVPGLVRYAIRLGLVVP